MYGFSRLTGALGGIGAARVAVRERWRAVVEIAGPPRIYRIAENEMIDMCIHMCTIMCHV